MPEEEKPVELSSEEADAIAEVIVLHQAIRFLEERGFVVTKGDPPNRSRARRQAVMRPADGREEIERDAA